MITIWKYAEAPPELKNLGPPTSAATWVLRTPSPLAAEIEAFLQQNGAEVTLRHDAGDGTVVFFGLAPRRKAMRVAGFQ